MRAWIVIAMCVPAVAAADVDGKKVDAVMAPWAKKDGPGCAVAIVQDGVVAHAKGYGAADLERRVPIAPETVFDIGSTSKQFTAAAIHLLAAEGKLKLDDDLRKYLPELPQVGKGVVTIRHLLHHTGGLRDYTALLVLGGTRLEDVATVKQTIAALARQKGVDFEPGAKYQYSNTGYFLLAQVVERASKQAMAKFVDERIFKPLGMTRSLVLDDHTRLVPDRAIGYAPKKGGGWRLDMSQWEQTGDGAVQTSVLDLVKWDANFAAPKVGGKALVDALQLRGKTADGKTLDYASGLVHGTYRGQARVSHGGAWAGYRAELMRFPAQRTSIIVLCNAATAQPTELAHAIADVVLDKKLDPAPAKPAVAAAYKLSPAGLDAWAGTYRDDKGDIVTIVRAGDKLTVDAGGTTLELVPTGERTLTIAGMELAIERGGTAPKRTITVKGPVTAGYTEVAPHKPTAADLTASPAATPAPSSPPTGPSPSPPARSPSPAAASTTAPSSTPRPTSSRSPASASPSPSPAPPVASRAWSSAVTCGCAAIVSPDGVGIGGAPARRGCAWLSFAGRPRRSRRRARAAATASSGSARTRPPASASARPRGGSR